MISKRTWSRALVIAGAVMAIVPATAAAAPHYPDLRPKAPAFLWQYTALINGETHHVIRFTTDIVNVGEGPLEMHGTPRELGGSISDVDQWVYDDLPALPLHERVGTFEWHEAHGHYHFQGFSEYQLWTAAQYQLALRTSFHAGRPMRVSNKIGFCLIDSYHAQPERGNEVGVYQDCGQFLQGISIGWADRYPGALTDQWVDVGSSPLPDGAYVVRIITDPGNIVFESPGKADPARESQLANASATSFRIENGILLTD